MRKWLYVGLGAIGALTLVVGVLAVTTTARAAESPVGLVNGFDSALKLQIDPDGSRFQHGPGGGRGRGGGFPIGDHRDAMSEALADALGITVEELEAAFEEAQAAALEQAVEDGLLTEEQVEQMQAFGGGRGMHMVGGKSGEHLADALGISVEELEAAMSEAFTAMLDDAVADGMLTQEQADLITAHSALREYMPDAMAEAYENAVNDALSDGAITQGQADLLLENAPGEGMQGFGFHGGFGRGGGRGHHRGPGGEGFPFPPAVDG